MKDNNAIRQNILAKLDEWQTLDSAVREDAFIEVDLLDGSVNFIDADELIRYDLQDPESRLSYFTINPWDFAEYDEDTDTFSFIEAEVEESIKNALTLAAEQQIK